MTYGSQGVGEKEEKKNQKKNVKNYGVPKVLVLGPLKITLLFRILCCANATKKGDSSYHPSLVWIFTRLFFVLATLGSS